MPDTQLQYWVISGRSTPSLWLSACTADCDAKLPRIARPGLLGSTLPARKMIKLSRIRVSTVSPRRLSRYPATCPPTSRIRRPPELRAAFKRYCVASDCLPGVSAVQREVQARYKGGSSPL